MEIKKEKDTIELVSTRELAKELVFRPGVQCFWVDPEELFRIVINDGIATTQTNKGACRILVVWD